MGELWRFTAGDEPSESGSSRVSCSRGIMSVGRGDMQLKYHRLCPIEAGWDRFDLVQLCCCTEKFARMPEYPL